MRVGGGSGVLFICVFFLSIYLLHLCFFSAHIITFFMTFVNVSLIDLISTHLSLFFKDKFKRNIFSEGQMFVQSSYVIN